MFVKRYSTLLSSVRLQVLSAYLSFFPEKPEQTTEKSNGKDGTASKELETPQGQLKPNGTGEDSPSEVRRRKVQQEVEQEVSAVQFNFD